ncbi:MAG: 50S ribosomal protein L10 [Alphaproteobacteria bacterium]|nr:50S ribosomal protein L10 [Alphaproteobacteria bacterium]
MNRTEKSELIDTLHATFSDAASVVITHQVGLTVVESSALRGKMRENGASYKVTKNRIAKLALKDTAYEGLSDQFTGPTAVGTSSDPVAAAKTLVEFAKENKKLTIVGGAIGGQILDKAGVEALASLPSLDELRGKLVGLMQAPATKVARVVQAPAAQLARVIKAKSEQA